jgi:hypothetical protein
MVGRLIVVIVRFTVYYPHGVYLFKKVELRSTTAITRDLKSPSGLQQLLPET